MPPLDGEGPSQGLEWYENIKVTWFSGSTSRSGVDCSGNARCVALPSRTAVDQRKIVEVCYNDKCTIAQVLDLGPWCRADEDYVFGSSRPFAEIYEGDDLDVVDEAIGSPDCHSVPEHPRETKISNGAGIDLTPALMEAIGASSGDRVKWRFVED